MAQLVARIDDELAEALDRLVADGVVASRSEAVRDGLVRLIALHRQRAIDAQIVASYKDRPQTAAEVGWADEASFRMIADEPW